MCVVLFVCFVFFPLLQLSLLQFIVREIELFWAAEKVTKMKLSRALVTKRAYLMNNVVRHLVLGEKDFSMPSR